MILTTLVVGAHACAREAAIAATLDSSMTTAVMLEGLPDTNSTLALNDNPGTLKIVRIGPACPCCSGNLILRVTLNRILRHPPQRLYISLANSAHLDLLHHFLCQTPYDKLLSITKDMHV